MSNIQSLRGEQQQARTRKKIAQAVTQLRTDDPKKLAQASGVSLTTLRRNAAHIAASLAQVTRTK